MSNELQKILDDWLYDRFDLKYWCSDVARANLAYRFFEDEKIYYMCNRILDYCRTTINIESIKEGEKLYRKYYANIDPNINIMMVYTKVAKESSKSKNNIINYVVGLHTYIEQVYYSSDLINDLSKLDFIEMNLFVSSYFTDEHFNKLSVNTIINLFEDLIDNFTEITHEFIEKYLPQYLKTVKREKSYEFTGDMLSRYFCDNYKCNLKHQSPTYCTTAVIPYEVDSYNNVLNKSLFDGKNGYTNMIKDIYFDREIYISSFIAKQDRIRTLHTNAVLYNNSTLEDKIIKVCIECIRKCDDILVSLEWMLPNKKFISSLVENISREVLILYKEFFLKNLFESSQILIDHGIFTVEDIISVEYEEFYVNNFTYKYVSNVRCKVLCCTEIDEALFRNLLNFDKSILNGCLSFIRLGNYLTEFCKDAAYRIINFILYVTDYSCEFTLEIIDYIRNMFNKTRREFFVDFFAWLSNNPYNYRHVKSTVKLCIFKIILDYNFTYEELQIPITFQLCNCKFSNIKYYFEKQIIFLNNKLNYS